MKKTIVLITLAILGLSTANAQVGIGTTNPDPSAKLEISATGNLAGKGLLLTPQTSAAIDNNIKSDTQITEGILVYDSTINTFKVTNTNGEWVNLSDNSKVAVATGTPTADTHSVGIGTTTVDVNATLDITVSGKGVLLPRLGSDPTSAVEGMMYYNDTDNEVRYYNGTSWVKLGL